MMKNVEKQLLLNTLKREASSCYVSPVNDIVYKRMFVTKETYIRLCKALNLEIKNIAPLFYKATRPELGYRLDWMEGDMILAFNQISDCNKEFIYKKNDILFRVLIKYNGIMTSELFEAIKEMIHNDRLLIFEDSTGMKACDDYIYNTNCCMQEIELIPTYTESESEKEKITQVDIFFKVVKNKNNEVKRYNQDESRNKHALFEAICN